MINFFIKIRRWPDFDDVEKTKENKEYKEVSEVVFLDEEPCRHHTKNFVDHDKLWIVKIQFFLHYVCDER